MILFYVILTHFIPGFLFETRQFKFIDDGTIYNKIDKSLAIFAFMLGYLFLLLLVDVGLKKIYYKTIISHRTSILKGIMPFILMLSLLVSIVSYFVLPRNFRYLDIGISESDSFFPLLVYTILPSLNTFFLFYHIFCGRFPFPAKYDFVKYFVVGSLFFSANGTNTFIVFLIGALYIFFPKIIRKGCFIVKKNLLNFLIRPLLIILLIIIVVYPLAIIFGQSIKTGQSFDDAYVKLKDNGSEDMGSLQYEYGLIRFNQYYVSSKVSFYTYFAKLDIEKRVLFSMSIIKNLAYRFSRILKLPIEIQKPQFSSASKINFTHIAPYSSEREGTSTGLFAGFLYFFPTPFNILMLLGYSSFLMVIINNISQVLFNKLSLLGMTLFLYWIFALFEGPIDFLLIIDDGFLVLLLYILYFL